MPHLGDIESYFNSYIFQRFHRSSEVKSKLRKLITRQFSNLSRWIVLTRNGEKQSVVVFLTFHEYTNFFSPFGVKVTFAIVPGTRQEHDAEGAANYSDVLLRR